MAIETNDIFEALKLKPVETKEELIAAIEEAGWIQEEQIFKDQKLGERIFGRAFGTSTTNVAKTFRNLGIEITGPDLKNPIEKVVETGLKKLQETFEAKKLEIENNNKLSADERIKQAEEAKNKLAEKVTQLEDLVKTKAQEFESTLTAKEQEVRSIRLNTQVSEAKRRLPFLPDLDPLKRRGWEATMEEKYRVESEEDGTAYPVEATTGQRIKSTQHAGTFLGLDELYQMEAAKAGIINIAPQGGKPAPAAAAKQEPGAPATETTKRPQNPGRIVAPSAIIQ